MDTSGPSQAVTWGANGARGIKLKGWVRPGVYRFWVDGMRRKISGGLKGKVIDE